jgi:hypothetical protein
MMNRIFDPDTTIDLPVAEPPPEPIQKRLPPSRSETASAAPSQRREAPMLLLAVLGGVCMVSAVSTVLYIRSWNQVQQNLRQERNLLLVERLRSLGPAIPAPAPVAPPQLAPAPVALQPAGLPAEGAVPGDGLPPPPDEPWIEELSQLPEGERPAAPILRVPVSPRLAAAAAAPPAALPSVPAAPRPAARAIAATPVLVGVVAAAGKTSSAIFQVGAATTSVGVGEAIGTSGWRLRGASGDTAEIEREGEVRRVSISNGG